MTEISFKGLLNTEFISHRVSPSGSAVTWSRSLCKDEMKPLSWNMGKIPQNVCCSKSIVLNLLSDRPAQKVPKSNKLFEAYGLVVLLLSQRMRKLEIVNFVYVPRMSLMLLFIISTDIILKIKKKTNKKTNKKKTYSTP